MSTAIDSAERPAYSRRGSTNTAQGLGLAASADSPHRRSMSESPFLSAKIIRDQVPGGGLEAVPEEAEAVLPPDSGRSSVASEAEGIAPLPHSVNISASPFSHSASLASGANLSAPDHPFVNPFQTQPPYGSPQVDNGDEVQLAIEVCKIKNLNNFFIVHVSRRKGNVWAYKHLYHLITERLALRSDDTRRFAPRS
ncbi:hypothetical protein GGH20_005327 [Coemansia sp. RSA 1937]|nr:hypothetical protein GGH20_005327 [Coemansia sp. RSA 1937]